MNILVYYNQNPNLNLPGITTIDHEVEYLENCKKYANGYYVKGKHLIWNGINWVKKPAKAFDYELQQDTDNTKDLLHGIVAVSKKGEETHGFFTKNSLTNCKVITGGALINCIDFALLPEKFYTENLCEGIYYLTKDLDAKQIAELGKKKLIIDNAGNTYNIEDNKDIYQQAIENFEKSVFPIDSDLKHAARYLGNITFGIELETINGTLPEHLRNKYGIIICKDGSIRDKNAAVRAPYPPEYVSVPYRGAKGLQAIRNLSIEIEKRSDIDIKCSYHLHLGGFDITRVFLVSLFKLCCKIQKDVFIMFPYYKLKPDGIKQQNYCKKLPEILSYYNKTNFNQYINIGFNDLYGYLSGGKEAGVEYNRKDKLNPWGGEKWNIKTRYHWVNFINPFFGKRDTIEFRIHTPTLNPDKIINWLFMCNAIVKYAETFIEKNISKTPVAFEEVLGYYGDAYKNNYGRQLSERLVAYYKDRVAYFAKDIAKNNYISPEELNTDKDFKFNITQP